MQRPLRVAVIIPAFNCEAFLAETLLSIRAQVRRADEIIVVNDASTDRSSEIARSFGVTVIDLPQSGGPSAARNRGIRATNADVIALCDADDIWLEDHLASVVGLLERFPTAGMSFSRVKLFGVLNHEQDRAIPPNVPTAAFWEQYHENIAFPSGMAFRRSVWRAIGGFDEARELIGCEDWEFTLRLAARHPLVCADHISARYRKHAAQLTSTSRPRIRRAEYAVRARMLADARKRASSEYVAQMESAFLRAWVGRLRESWAERSWFWMRLHLSLHRLVPGSGPAFRKWLLRSALMPLAWLADRMPTSHHGYDVRRRDLIKTIGAVTVAAMVPHDAIAAWARVASGIAPARVLSGAQLALIGAIADTLIPCTSTPGALDVGVPAFVHMVVSESFTGEERRAFSSGLATIDSFLRDRQGRAFVNLDAASRGARIADIENHGIVYRAVSKLLRHGEPRRTYWQLKELIVHGYFTSDRVAKQVLREDVMAGAFDGAAPFAGRTDG